MSTRTLTILIVSFLVLAGGMFFLSERDRSEDVQEFTPSALDNKDETTTTIDEEVVAPAPVEEVVTQKACVTGGCSGHVCAEEGSNMASTCEFLPEYSCLKQYAVCERQTTGKCGWTQTETYNQCMIEISEK